MESRPKKTKVLLLGFGAFGLNHLIDSNSDIELTAGSFGTPYKVEPSSHFHPIRDSSNVSGYNEQDIVFVDLSFDISNIQVGQRIFAEDCPGLWVKCDHGFIDPRAMAAAQVQKGFDRIVNTGGVVVVFSSPKTNMTMQWATANGGKLWHQKDFPNDEWSFLSDLHEILVTESEGKEVVVCDQRSPIGRAMQDALPSMYFQCTVEPTFAQNEWLPLAKNKFGEPLALQKRFPSGGAIIVLPQMQDKEIFIKRLLTDSFPEMFPRLFPGIEKGRWTHLPEYELVEVSKLQVERELATRRHESEIGRIEAEIVSAREVDGWLHELMTQTGDSLVNAVMTALHDLGFSDVVDMDKIRDRDNKSRREDLQVRDISPTLVIDVKGINNFPSDEDVMQAFKHATLIMREQARFDVFGVSLINHQRHLPPLHRDNSLPFRKELLDVALENRQGLMTTWDLYRLVVNKRKHSWESRDVKPVLYRHGRIEPVPNHYVLLGHISQTWQHAFGVDIENSSVNVGDTISLEFDTLFEEGKVKSLQVDGKSKAQASPGDKTGISWPTSYSRPKPGMRVFVIKPSVAEDAEIPEI